MNFCVHEMKCQRQIKRELDIKWKKKQDMKNGIIHERKRTSHEYSKAPSRKRMESCDGLSVDEIFQIEGNSVDFILFRFGNSYEMERKWRNFEKWKQRLRIKHEAWVMRRQRAAEVSAAKRRREETERRRQEQRKYKRQTLEELLECMKKDQRMEEKKRKHDEQQALKILRLCSDVNFPWRRNGLLAPLHGKERQVDHLVRAWRECELPLLEEWKEQTRSRDTEFIAEREKEEELRRQLRANSLRQLRASLEPAAAALEALLNEVMKERKEKEKERKEIHEKRQ
eukprot:GHVR01062386.1.p1 GENE.GHVR01062386.1~~GHVR01062386.1.p1  ORF type:complete len:284 (-),score=56.44 GHVR01062386.1:628-1479(-)